MKPSSSLTIDVGKRVFNWGKGYAWNPVAFVDRPKDPNDPELPREGYIAATADYIKSFSGPLKTFSVTPVIFPVYHHINDTFGDWNHLNFAGRIYGLLYDTDIDLLFLVGESKTSGLDSIFQGMSHRIWRPMESLPSSRINRRLPSMAMAIRVRPNMMQRVSSWACGTFPPWTPLTSLSITITGPVSALPS